MKVKRRKPFLKDLKKDHLIYIEYTDYKGLEQIMEMLDGFRKDGEFSYSIKKGKNWMILVVEEKHKTNTE